MSEISYEEVEFMHLVVFKSQQVIFAAARIAETRKIMLFLIHEDSGRIYTHNGKTDSWQELSDNERDTVIIRLITAHKNNIPVYKINGDCWKERRAK